jgi:hypothetical protein
VSAYGRVIIAAVIAYYTGGLVASSAWANCTVVGSSWVGTAVAGAAGGAAFGAYNLIIKMPKRTTNKSSLKAIFKLTAL